MTQTTKIEWCKTTWNPVTGCDAVSPGCERCYARAFAKRLAGRCGYDKDDPFAVTLRPERLAEPFGLTGRQRVFVCSMGDLFHPDVPAYFIRAVLAVISLAGEHTFVLLTKRPALMHAFFMTQRLPACQAELLSRDAFRAAAKASIKRARQIDLIGRADKRRRLRRWHDRAINGTGQNHWPLPNLILGISAENQECLDHRLEYLAKTPAAARAISLEPLLEAVSPQLRPDGRATCIICGGNGPRHQFADCPHAVPALTGRILPDGIIVGGETGPGARPIEADWVREIRDQCVASGTPFFFKRWGPSRPGRILDGRTWDEFPDVSMAAGARK